MSHFVAAADCAGGPRANIAGGTFSLPLESVFRPLSVGGVVRIEGVVSAVLACRVLPNTFRKVVGVDTHPNNGLVRPLRSPVVPSVGSIGGVPDARGETPRC